LSGTHGNGLAGSRPEAGPADPFSVIRAALVINDHYTDTLANNPSPDTILFSVGISPREWLAFANTLTVKSLFPESASTLRMLLAASDTTSRTPPSQLSGEEARRTSDRYG
jgi:hypothetical protein